MVDTTILGGGIAGLATAHRLAERGHKVTLLEASDRLGGLGGTFEHHGKNYERFYHSITQGDDALLSLIHDAGLGEQCQWTKTTMGMIVDDGHYDFNTPVDLLRFAPLTFGQRLRLGAVGKSLRLLGRKRDLDNLTAEAWLRPLFGAAVWDKVIEPMFTMKFGGAPVPALYLYERLARESNVAMRAYPRIGYQGLADGIAASIERMGGTIHTNTTVHKLALDFNGDNVVISTDAGEATAARVVSTLPLPLLNRIVTGELLHQLNPQPLAFMGVVNMLFLTTRPLDGHYWSAVINSGTEFDGQVEMSTLTGPHFDGLYGTYVMKYCDRDGLLFHDPKVAERWREQFLALNRLLPHEVPYQYLFKAPFVEPVWPLGYTKTQPTPQVGNTPLYLATTAQAYPRVTSWNAGVQTAEHTVTVVES